MLIRGRNADAVLLQAPVLYAGTPDTGTATVGFNVPLWLQDDFDNNGSLDDPQATATFGIYRGHDRVIYWREVRP
jgi:MSHA biogenesis protein MshQ